MEYIAWDHVGSVDECEFFRTDREAAEWVSDRIEELHSSDEIDRLEDFPKNIGYAKIVQYFRLTHEMVEVN